MQLERIDYYQIRVDMPDSASPKPLHSQQYKDGMWVGAHTKPSGDGAAAMLNSRELADDYLNSLLPVYEKRYGSETKLEIVMVQGGLSKKDKDRLQIHSKTVRARIDTNNFAPNKKVVFQSLGCLD